MFREGIQVMLQAEMDEHLGYQKHAPESVEYANSRNGKTSKRIKSKFGEMPIEVPRDRDSSFQPQLIPKRSRIMAEIEDHVLSQSPTTPLLLANDKYCNFRSGLAPYS